MSKVNRSVSNDPAARIQNLQLLVNRIKHFYLTDLQQLIITPLPKIGDISADPHLGESTLHYVYIHSVALVCESTLQYMG